MGIFDDIYKQDAWGFGSGHGSLPKVTKTYREFLATFIRENDIKTITDVGCGDWQFSRLVDWGDAQYLGLDIVESVVERNQQQFSTDKISFKPIKPGLNTDIPGGDLLIIKDVLQHMSDKDVQAFLKEVLPKFRYALITNCILPLEDVNAHIASGEFRPLDIRKKPFNVKAAVVHTFVGPKVFSRSTKSFFPAWKKLVLLIQN